MDIQKQVQPAEGDYALLSTDRNLLNEFMAYPKSAIEGNKVAILLLHDIIEPELNNLLADIKQEYHLK